MCADQINMYHQAIQSMMVFAIIATAIVPLAPVLPHIVPAAMLTTHIWLIIDAIPPVLLLFILLPQAELHIAIPLVKDNTSIGIQAVVILVVFLGIIGLFGSYP